MIRLTLPCAALSNSIASNRIGTRRRVDLSCYVFLVLVLVLVVLVVVLPLAFGTAGRFVGRGKQSLASCQLSLMSVLVL